MQNTKVATAIPRIVPKESWDREFSIQRAIPSSTRTEPARALLLFGEILNLSTPMRILDAGAGNGRNAIYLARRGCTVTALDFSGSALTEARRRIDEAGMAQRVSLVAHSLTDPLPFTDASFDFSLDAYVFCHFLEEDARLGFWRNMARVTKRGGHLLSIVFSTEDEYYSRLLRTSPGHGLVCDPVNGIWKRLYTETEIRDFFASKFELSYFAKFEFSDAVLGDKYRRVVLISVLRNQAA